MLDIVKVFILLILFSSCGKKESKEEKSVKNSPKDLVSQIIFEDFENYKEFREKLQNLHCKQNISLRNLDSLLANNHIRIIYEECEDIIACICCLENTMHIWNDTSKIFKKANISAELKKHYTNNGKDPMYADNPHKLVVEIGLPDTQDVKTLEQVLEELIFTFKKLNYRSEIKELSNLIFSFIGKNTSQEYHSKAPFLTLKFIKYLPPPPPPVPQN